MSDSDLSEMFAPGAGDGRSATEGVDVTRVLVTAEIVIGAVVVAGRLMRRPAAPKAVVTMGPGGWVSMKGGAMAVRPARRLWRRTPAPRPAAPRPLWARLLSAAELEQLVGRPRPGYRTGRGRLARGLRR